MTQNSQHFYEFGPFRLDPIERQLWRDGEEIALTPKAFGVLLLLIRNRGHVVNKDEFMREVWPDTIVEEKNLTDNICDSGNRGIKARSQSVAVVSPGQDLRRTATKNKPSIISNGQQMSVSAFSTT